VYFELSSIMMMMMMMIIIIIIIIINYKISLTGQCAHTTENAKLKVQNIFLGRNDITCSINCKYRTAATLYTLETWFVSGI
jgi:hypothetical protein